MEKSAETISAQKFRKLTHRQCHKVLADLARSALARSEPGTFASFSARYEEMTSWVSVDRYTPPLWLTPREAMEEAFFFHLHFAQGGGPEGAFQEPQRKVSWAARVPIDVVLDQIRSPFNVGSILRIMDNFGFGNLIHATPTLSATHPQLRKSARGCETWIPIRYCPDLPRELERTDRDVIALECEENAIPIHAWRPQGPCRVVLGNETYGISTAIRELCSTSVRIPMQGFKGSLNVSHAFAIFAYHCATHWTQDGR